MNEVFGVKLDSYCKKQGITIKQLANLLGVTRNTVGNWKANGRPPKSDLVVKIAKVFYLTEEETNDFLVSAGFSPQYPAHTPSFTKTESGGTTSSEPQIDLASTEERYRQQIIAFYNVLQFSGLGFGDLFLSEIPLEKVFVRLSLTVKRYVRETAKRQFTHGEDRQHVVKVQEPVAISEALKHNLLIVGEPGAGKSTLLRWLTLTFAQKNQQEQERLGPDADVDRLPVLVELSHLPERYLKVEGGEMPNWLQLLPQLISNRQGFEGIPPQLLAQALRDGRCLLLFDGLDEITHQQVRFRLADSLTELTRLSPGNRVIIGSRPAGVSECEGALLPKFKQCQIERFTQEDVQHFISFWYNLDTSLTPVAQQDAAAQLYMQIQAAPGILRLAKTPLLSTLLLLIWRNEGALPERRVELYRRCCRMLLTQWELHHDISYRSKWSILSWEQQLRLLSSLAYFIHHQEQRTDITRAELVDCLTQALLDEKLCMQPTAAKLEAVQFLTEMSMRSGLLQYIGNDRFSFSHLTFQEYLTAYYITLQGTYTDFLTKHLHDTYWQEVIMLLFGMLSGEKAATIQLYRILENKSADILKRDLLFASTCLLEEVVVEKRLVETVLIQLGDLLRFSPYPTQRKNVLQIFASLIKTQRYGNTTNKALQKIITSDNAFTETILQASFILYCYSSEESDGYQIASAKLLSLAEASRVSIDRFVYLIDKYSEDLFEKLYSAGIIQQIEVILEHSSHFPEGIEPLDPPLWLLELEPIELPDYATEHKIDLAYRLIQSSDTEKRKRAIKLLSEITSTVSFPVQPIIALLHEIINSTVLRYLDAGYRIKGSIVSALQMADPEYLQEVVQATDLLLQLTQRIIPPTVLTIEAANLLYELSPASSNEEQLVVKVLMNLAHQPDLPIEQRRKAICVLCTKESYKEEAKEAAQILLDLAQRVDPPNDETIAAAQDLYRMSNYRHTLAESREAGQMLLQWMSRTDIANDHKIAAATGLLMGYLGETTQKHGYFITQVIKQLISQEKISTEKIVTLAQRLRYISYKFDDPELWRLIENHLLRIAQHKKVTLKQKLDAIQILLRNPIYVANQLQAVQLVFALLQKNVAIRYLEEHFNTELEEFEKEEDFNTLVPFITELSQDEQMHEEFRDYMYRILSFLMMPTRRKS